MYEAALTDRINWLRVRKAKPSVWLSEHENLLDQAFTYVRLSQSQASRGATQESMRSLDSAVAVCTQLQMKACTAEKLVDAVKFLDDRQRSRCKSSEDNGR